MHNFPDYCRGLARTQTPTTTNYAPEFPTFGEIARVSPTEVQWKGLALGEPPCWSRYPLSQVSMTIFDDIWTNHTRRTHHHQVTYEFLKTFTMNLLAHTWNHNFNYYLSWLNYTCVLRCFRQKYVYIVNYLVSHLVLKIFYQISMIIPSICKCILKSRLT